jgi:hypothetical protein
LPAARLASAVLGRVDEVRERLREVQQLQERVAAALDAARGALAQARVALAAALAMPVKEKCGGCPRGQGSGDCRGRGSDRRGRGADPDMPGRRGSTKSLSGYSGGV